MTKWYPHRDITDQYDNFMHTEVWYCLRCRGNGRWYKPTIGGVYPFFELVDPCPACRGEGARIIRTVKVRSGLL